MAEEEKLKKKPDPRMLANLQLLQEMDKIRMFQQLHLLEKIPPGQSHKKEAKAEKKDEKKEETK